MFTNLCFETKTMMTIGEQTAIRLEFCLQSSPKPNSSLKPAEEGRAAK